MVLLTNKNIKLAKSAPFKCFIIEASDLKKPAKLVSSEVALVERYPIVNDPGPYLIGTGDVKGFRELFGSSNMQNARVTGTLIVNEDGLINFFQL